MLYNKEKKADSIFNTIEKDSSYNPVLINKLKLDNPIPYPDLMENIISNAIKFAPESTKVMIKSDVNDDTALMVNATMNGQLDVPAQVVRLRLLNGSSQRTFNFGLTANRTFYLIGTDGGLINTPLALTRLPLSPGARAEILVDFSSLQGQTIHLMSYASELANGNYGATYPGNSPSKPLDGYNPNPLNGADFNVLQMDVVAQTASPITTIPTTLVNDVPLAEVTADETRSFRFAPLTSGSQQLNGDFSINGVTMDMNVINVTVPLNNTEIWTLENFSAIAHPFHIHDVQNFKVIK